MFNYVHVEKATGYLSYSRLEYIQEGQFKNEIATAASNQPSAHVQMFLVPTKCKKETFFLTKECSTLNVL